ncbi:MAG: endolytic transglycosylase MltG [Clostridia bacterium]|nr:endolytic transglycosylase MltG [Clostridia bacterium]
MNNTNNGNGFGTPAGDRKAPDVRPAEGGSSVRSGVPAENGGNVTKKPAVPSSDVPNPVSQQPGAQKQQAAGKVQNASQGVAAKPQTPPARNAQKAKLPPKADATVAIKTQQKLSADTTSKDATKQLAPQQKTSSAEIPKGKGKSARAKKSGTTEAGNTVMSLVKCMAYITVVLIVSIIISVFVILAANDMYGFVKSTDPVEVTIPEGADLDDVADILHDNNVIRYKWLFKMKNKGVSDFKAGTYTVLPSQSYENIIAEFREKIPTGVSWITIPEGFTTDEIIDLLVESGIGKRERYVDVINNYDFDYWFIDELGEDWASDGRIYRLDGYLFPDTYQFYNASSEETVIKKLLTRFNQVFVKSYRERAAELGYTVDEILTLASIIEKEAANQSEFGDVSSVFHNRLNDPANFPRLESDATVVYSIQHETGVRPNLTGEDLERDDPYNSYKVDGLVPGPIANPSNSAILAALNPKNTNYYYFVSNGKQTYFASDLAGHNANKAKYLKQNAE